MATSEQQAIAQLDGRDPDQPNYPPRAWVGVTHYKGWDFGQDWVDRPAGADGGKNPDGGAVWWSPSKIDNITVLAEILTKKFRGKYTMLHMLSAVFAVDVLGEDPAEVKAKLDAGLP